MFGDLESVRIERAKTKHRWEKEKKLNRMLEGLLLFCVYDAVSNIVIS